MQIQLQRLGLVGLTVAIAAFAHQPIIEARMRSEIQLSEKLSGPTAPPVPVPSMLASVPHLTKAGAAPFVSVGHSASGSAQIVTVDGQQYLEFDSAFRTDSGPDLLVLLHSDAVPDSYSPEDYVSLGQLQRVAGTQRYAIPADVDISSFQSAVIWCRAFDVTFGYATL
ncbi:MAG: DM13 domain-containing protein [Phormidesmis sp.]